MKGWTLSLKNKLGERGGKEEIFFFDFLQEVKTSTILIVSFIFYFYFFTITCHCISTKKYEDGEYISLSLEWLAAE